MKYANIIKLENEIKLKHDLCELYVACDCLEEFIIKANLTFGKIPWRLLTSFKLFYAKKSKPLLYYGIKLSLYLLLGYFVCTAYFALIFLFPISGEPSSNLPLIWQYSCHLFRALGGSAPRYR